MLQRKDLAKEFELVVKQEIKNFQDLSNQILESIRSLKVSHTSLQEDLNKKYASLHSVTSSHDSVIKQSNESLKNNIANSASVINVIEQKHDILKEMVLFIKKEAEDCREDILTLITEFMNQKECVKELKNLVFSFKNDFDQSISSAMIVLKNEMKEIEKKLFEKPCTCLPEVNRLKDNLSSHTVDVVGISKMMKILQKELMITDKKIEAVHMLLKKEV